MPARRRTPALCPSRLAIHRDRFRARISGVAQPTMNNVYPRYRSCVPSFARKSMFACVQNHRGTQHLTYYSEALCFGNSLGAGEICIGVSRGNGGRNGTNLFCWGDSGTGKTTSAEKGQQRVLYTADAEVEQFHKETFVNDFNNEDYYTNSVVPSYTARDLTVPKMKTAEEYAASFRQKVALTGANGTKLAEELCYKTGGGGVRVNKEVSDKLKTFNSLSSASGLLKAGWDSVLDPEGFRSKDCKEIRKVENMYMVYLSCGTENCSLEFLDTVGLSAGGLRRGVHSMTTDPEGWKELWKSKPKKDFSFSGLEEITALAVQKACEKKFRDPAWGPSLLITPSKEPVEAESLDDENFMFTGLAQHEGDHVYAKIEQHYSDMKELFNKGDSVPDGFKTVIDNIEEYLVWLEEVFENGATWDDDNADETAILEAAFAFSEMHLNTMWCLLSMYEEALTTTNAGKKRGRTEMSDKDKDDDRRKQIAVYINRGTDINGKAKDGCPPSHMVGMKRKGPNKARTERLLQSAKDSKEIVYRDNRYYFADTDEGRKFKKLSG